MGRASASLWGPSFNLFSLDLRNGYVARHETMHIFGAMDQYCPDACRSPIIRHGYLEVVNANSKGNDGNGFFGGAGEGQPDIMISNAPIGVFSRGQIGWRDTDGDGILDPLDTYPKSNLAGSGMVNPVSLTGVAEVSPLMNQLAPGRDVTLNTIANVEYRINGGAWAPADPVDGAFDWGEEAFNIVLPGLPDSSYRIDVRATNSVGNTEQSFTSATFSISQSSLSNASPVASMIVDPPQGSTATDFFFDASEVTDLEDLPSILEVRDSQGSTASVTKFLAVASTNLAPQVQFTATPENQHARPRSSLIGR